LRAFEQQGWVFRRQAGSHMILTKAGSIVSLSIPDHRELAPGTLRKLIRLAGLDVDEFRASLK
jgi:predicted RNA binding protein YcfA (HicA-like mRNA interferase family)